MNIIAVLIFKGEKMAKKGRVEKKINENKEEEKLFSPEKKKKKFYDAVSVYLSSFNCQSEWKTPFNKAKWTKLQNITKN